MAEDIIKPKTYLAVWAALMLLTGATAWIAQIDIAPFNALIALLIAFTKASLVVIFFMHLYFSSRVTKLALLAAVLWLALLMCITMTDYLTRGWMSYAQQ